VAPDGDVWAVTSGGLVHWGADGSYTEVSNPDWPEPAPRSIAFTPDGDLWLGFYIDVIQVTDTGTVRHQFNPDREEWSGIELAVGPDGQIWAAAAQFGVHRFDGIQWHAVIAELPARGDLDTFTVDTRGRPWIGSYWSGLRVLDGAELRQETSLTTRIVQAGSNGDVWYKIDEGHDLESVVVHLDGVSGTRTEYALGAINVWDIAPTGGAAYIATNPLTADNSETYGLWRLSDGQIEPVPGSWDEPQDQILAVAVAEDAAVWLGGQSGVWRYDGESEHHYLTDTFHSFSVGYINTGGDSLVWSGDCTDSSVYDGEQWQALPSLPDQLFACDTVIDSDGVLWLAGEDGIAHRRGDSWVVDHSDASGSSWRGLYPPCLSEACEEPHWSLAAGTEAGIWAGMIGVENGLWRFQRGAWQRMTDILPAGSGPVVETTTAADDTLWVATENGVHHLGEGGWVSYPSGVDGPPADIVALAVGGGGEVWARTYGEIAHFDGDVWTSYPLRDDWYDNRILLVDPAGAAWLPTAIGAQRFDGSSFIALELPDSRPAHLGAMTIDATGSWWMTAGGRLYRWTP
jgi:ligand-binding sensor domain-containing protein